MSNTIRTKRLDGTTLVVETKDGSRTYDSQFLVAALLIFIARGSGSIVYFTLMAARISSWPK